MFMMTISLLIISDEKFPLSFSVSTFPAFDTLIPMIILSVGIIIIYNKTFVLDWIMLILLIRIGFGIVTIIANVDDIYEGLKDVLILMTSFLSYFIFVNKAKDISSRTFLNFISLYIIILATQTIATVILIYFEYSTVVKSLVEVPIGKSNFIATHILICLLILLIKKEKSKLHIISSLLGLIALLVTFSFGAIITLIVGIYLSLMMFKGNKKSIIFKTIITLISTFLLISFYNYVSNFTYTNATVFTQFIRNLHFKIEYFQNGQYDRLFSDRFILYQEGWKNFLENPIIGSFYGVEFRGTGNWKIHNLFLEALSSYGLLGFITFTTSILISIIYITKNLKFEENDNLIKACLITLIVGIIHGLVEPNFFSLEYEFIWWSIAGYTVGYSKFCLGKSKSFKENRYWEK
jgi:O-antigen ligase